VEVEVSAWLEITGLVGIFVAMAGAHQLWKAREDAFFWMGRYSRLFRRSLETRSRAEAMAQAGTAERPPTYGTLYLVGSVGLIALGSFLFIVSLALVVFHSLTNS
jgi:hypothetical protein